MTGSSDSKLHLVVNEQGELLNAIVTPSNTDDRTKLWEALGRGAKASWSKADKQLLETWVEDDPRTYNSTQLARKLQQQQQITLSPDWIRRVMK